jgi:uncharacterized protein YjiS (DUF1127 family)
MSHHRRISLRPMQALNLSPATTPHLRHPFIMALCRMTRAISPSRRSHRAGVLHLESLNEHVLRDIGLTNHVEQPWP